MRLMKIEEAKKRGCVFCLESKGTQKHRLCPYEECPYNELDGYATFKAFLKDNPIGKLLVKR